MTIALGGAPADVKPDPRYLIPYENPVATPYPAAIVSPGGPAITAEPTKISATKRPLRSKQDAMNKAKETRQDPARRFERSDRNKDGFVSLEEFIGNPVNRNVPVLTKRFEKIDSNGDGKLQLDEFKKQSK
jgi:hypothetical protein